jgi:putative transposase
MTKSRHFQGGRSYHVTQRCHGRAFLLGKDVDRRFYLNLLWEAKQDWPVSLFAYHLTSNHVHLLLSAAEVDALGGFMAKVSVGMARHYNRRKERAGAFWEGRYRTTLIQDGMHLTRCLFYIEMNMVWAGVVAHPREWPWSSYRELVGDRQFVTR